MRTAAASSEAVAKESRPSWLQEASSTVTSLSAPEARALSMTALERLEPTESMVMVPPTASFKRMAASRAFSSKGESTGGMPLGVTFMAVESTSKADGGPSGSGTCLTHTRMFISAMSINPPLSL